MDIVFRAQGNGLIRLLNKCTNFGSKEFFSGYGGASKTCVYFKTSLNTSIRNLNTTTSTFWDCLEIEFCKHLTADIEPWKFAI